MNALVRKELRLMFWPFVAAVLLAIVPGWIAAVRPAQNWGGRPVHEVVVEVYIFCFTLAALVLALTTFGQEFSLRTFTFTLAQPIERKTIWRLKTTILAGAIFLTIASVAVSIEVLRTFASTVLPVTQTFWSLLAATFLIGMTAYSGGLCTSLFFRNFLVSLTLSVLLPGVLLVCFSKWIFGVHATNPGTVAGILLGFYSIAAFVLARWQFFRSEDVILAGREISISRGRFQPLAFIGSFKRTNPYLALLRKELQMQQVAFVVAAILLVLHLASFPARGFLPKNSEHNLVAVALNFVCILWLALPLLIGSTAVADERRLGTHEMLLTLPISRRAELLTKFLVAMLLSFVFGSIMPYYLERIAVHFHLVTSLINEGGWSFFVVASFVLGLIAIFSSTKARSSLDAFCLSIVVTPIVLAVVDWFASSTSSLAYRPRYGILTPYIAALFVAPTLIWLTWKNFQRLQIRWSVIVGSWFVLALSVVATWLSCSFIWNRGWEHFMTLEPKHGAPVWRLGDHAKVFSAGYGAVAFLPDRRIWRAEYIYDTRFEKLNNGKVKDTHVVGLSITNTEFIPGTNWVDLAVGYEALAIKSDGTLWNVAEFKPTRGEDHRHHHYLMPPRQNGNDRDWSSLSSGTGYILALKRNGSLWGCGANKSGELGAGPTDGTNVMKEIWPGTKWTKVFASGPVCFGFKQDGSAWMWGGQFVIPAKYGVDYEPHHIREYSPTPSPFPGTNWAAFANNGPSLVLALRNDGTIWYVAKTNAAGFTTWLPRSEFGVPIVATERPLQFGKRSDWSKITAGGPFCTLNNSGQWLIDQGGWIGRRDTATTAVSIHTDWIDISSRGSLVGLAADGTVCSWAHLSEYPYYTVQSRRPAWSTNVFAVQ